MIKNFFRSPDVHPPFKVKKGLKKLNYFKTIIWSDTDQQKIYMCNLIKNSQFPKMIACNDNGNHTVLIGHDISYPESLAVDWIHGLLFWVDSRLETVSLN